MKIFKLFKKNNIACCLPILFVTTNMFAQNPHGILTIKPGAYLNIGKNATLVTNSNIDNKGTLKNAGSIILNGNTVQDFPGAGGSIPLMNVLEVNNTGAGVSLNSALPIAKELKLTSGNLALGNYDVTIQSTATQTAAVSAMGAGAGISYGTGRFVVERYINTGSGGHGKSWQLLAVPANGQTIKDCWQEAGVANAGYGTQITNPLGTAAGYDLYTPSTSIKTFVSATSLYDAGPVNTSAIIDNPKGYMLFVRGDRTVATGSGTTGTKLRIRGTLFTFAEPPAVIAVNAGKYESVGNPYASQIDFTMLTRTGGVDNKFYTWDPMLGGLYGVGGYQTITATNAWVPVPGGGNYAGTHTTIESGQAFFIQSTTTAGTLGFGEAVKTGGSNLVNRTESPASSSTRGFIRCTLLTNTGIIAGGNAAAFDTDLSNNVDGDDAPKLMNGGENMGLKRGSSILAVEGRSMIVSSDTLFYYTSNLLQQPYRFLIVPENMDLTKQAWLVDNFLHTQTQVSLSDTSYISFVVTIDAASARTDRFMMLFSPQTILALTATTLRAIRTVDNNIAISWKTIAETNVANYWVEKSANGISFNTIANIMADRNNGADASYVFKDTAPYIENNFYRIKINFANATTKYSEVVKVGPLKNTVDVSVFPNPTTGRILNLDMGKQLEGKYQLLLINTSGQQIWSSKILYSNNNGNKIVVELPNKLAAGNYKLCVLNKELKKITIDVTLL